jgi:Chromate transport protein ChrA
LNKGITGGSDMEAEKEKIPIDSKILWEFYITFFKLGAISFGGGYAMVPLIEHETVETKKWINHEKVIDIFAVAGSLPGAIGLNASALVGYHVAGIPGALAAILGNLSPSVLIVLTLSILFAKVSTYPVVQAAFNGLRPAIIALIAFAAYKIAKTAIRDCYCVLIAIMAFCGMVFINLNPILIIVIGALLGVLGDCFKTFMKKRVKEFK